MDNIRIILTQKKKGFDVESNQLLQDLRSNLKIKNLTDIRILNKYIVNGIDDKTYQKSLTTVFSETPIDIVYENTFKLLKDEIAFSVEFIPGQYDQRADSAQQCLMTINPKNNPKVRCAKIIILKGKVTSSDLLKIKKYYINTVESHEIPIDFNRIDTLLKKPRPIEILKKFIEWDHKKINEFYCEQGLAMTLDDLLFIQQHFIKIKRNPSITEIKVIDTYWSDHCRHTTFETQITKINFASDWVSQLIKKSYDEYLLTRDFVYGKNSTKKICLMDLATIVAKECKKLGLLNDLDQSDEINACSINIDVEVDNKIEKYLLMFKNETHNHPTEIEPFGGASTCLGGAIRDPLSGRSYVYQAMRVTGCADPTLPIEKTLKNKLPQKTITTAAANGYSSYGNQIGLATGQVDEIYHPNYVAKRLEVGAVIAATAKDHVVRKTPENGDVVILLGGKTGIDGIGGATGSSKQHNASSVLECGSQVQKGNAVCERKIQRFFLNSKVTKMIKRCNDFGAGGVSVAIGELAAGLEINLNAIPTKYNGLDATQLAISESQERMAVVIDKKDAKKFIELANQENLEATIVATVTNKNRLTMIWNNEKIVDLDRNFLDTNGVISKTNVELVPLVKKQEVPEQKSYLQQWKKMITNLNVCSKIGLIQKFDSSIGKNTVLSPLGGINQITPAEGMAAIIPTFGKKCNTASLMAYGFNPYLNEISCFHMGYYAVIESITKIVAMGGNWKNIRLSLQEYFEKHKDDPAKWGKPFAALLGAFSVQHQLKIPAIGGKDSMSGTYENIDVPPTLISFAITTAKVEHIISPEFKKIGSYIFLVQPDYLEDETIDLKSLVLMYDEINKLIKNKTVVAAYSLKHFGVAEAITKMCIGNNIGFNFDKHFRPDYLFTQAYGSIIIEIPKDKDDSKLLRGLDFVEIGQTTHEPNIVFEKAKINLKTKDVIKLYKSKLENIFPSLTNQKQKNINLPLVKTNKTYQAIKKIAKPLVTIVVFPGTNCEFDSKSAWEKAGAKVNIVLIKNLDSKMLLDSIDEFEKAIKISQIIMIPGGFSGGDEPDGSAKFIVNIFRNEKIKNAIEYFLDKQDGLMIGICNGFQALIKLGLLPYGKIVDITPDMPTLAHNQINHHMSTFVQTKIISNCSPWLIDTKLGHTYTLPISHGEGRFVCNEQLIKQLAKNGQIVAQYVDSKQKPTMLMPYNPNGSDYAIECIISPNGKIIGKMAHSERIGDKLYKNIFGDFDQKLFENGVKYFMGEKK